MTDKQVNLHPKNASSVNLKPNIIHENIPDKAVTLEKLDQSLQNTISTHTSSIATNRADINKNTTDIATNRADINKNTTDIATNRADINKNTSDIATNKTDIFQLRDWLYEDDDAIEQNTADIAKNRSDINKNTAGIESLKASVNTGTFDPTSDNPAGQKSTASALISKKEYYATYALYRFANTSLLHSYQFDGVIGNFLSATKIDGMFSCARFEWTNIRLTIPSFKNRITSAGRAFAFAADSHVVSVTFRDNSFKGNGFLYTASGLKSVGVADGAEVKLFSNCDYCFTECNNLVEIGAFDLSEATSLDAGFVHCYNLQHIHLKNISVSFDISASAKFEEADLVEILNNLMDLTGKTAQTLTMGATNLAKLTDEEKAVAVNKNWVLA